MHGSCTRTNPEMNPWWRVELPGVFNVTSVAIVNRGDCCEKLINGAEIRIGNSLENNGNNNTVAVVINHVKAGAIKTYKFKPIEGRFVNIFIPGHEKVLTLCEVQVFAENIATGARAVQSSTYDHLGNAENAVDGKRALSYMSGSCSHTYPERDPWWRVELPGVYNVTSVTITNRGDCCGERIRGAQIRIGNSLKNNGNNNQLVALICEHRTGETKTYSFKATEGRYVNIFLPGAENILTLCEVKVYTGARSHQPLRLHDRVKPTNIATRGRATQSSLSISGMWAGIGVAENAIDGNRNPDLEKGSCMQTDQESSPWWRVNLHHSHAVSSVALTNRGDCCSESLDGAEIRIGDSLENEGKDNPLCATVSSIPAGQTEHFNCSSLLQGTYVTIFLPGHGTLSLCEVEVAYFTLVIQNLELHACWKDTENIAVGAKAVQSSTYDSGHAQNAVDGNSNADYKKGSCSHTNYETNPWWRVELPGVYNVTSVTIINRGDCCGHRIIGAEIRIGNSLENNGNNNQLVAVMNSPLFGVTNTFSFKATEGRVVNIVLPGKSKILTLCEVRVFADEEAFRESPDAPENIAVGAKAVQSSTTPTLGNPEYAVDGNIDTDSRRGSCSHTETENNPWWRVELPGVCNVTSVTIVNRADCCSDRINGAQIRIGNSLKNNGNNNKLVAVIGPLGSEITKTYRFEATKGRFVNIFLPGKNKILSLCEVKVFADYNDLPNLALKGRATQSSLLTSGTLRGFGRAQNAIDGNRNSDLKKGSCTETEKESFPWWRMTLHQKYIISSVALTNRGDCCSERLDGAEIRIGDSLENDGKDNPLCATVSSIPAGQTKHYECSSLLEGSYVTVVLPREGTLSLCEVEVFGFSTDQCRDAIK
ncbi:uncharacterized protein [Salminus brasiliensis]|uniref:uncharacterized protein n=1 Tax=Salminus brasiliensis TaxID=930266 RepID=UPI003B836594